MRTWLARAAIILAALLAAVSSTPTAAWATTATDTKFIQRVYSDFLLRPPTNDEVTWWLAYLPSGSRLTMVNSVIQSSDFATLWVTGVNLLYNGELPVSGEETAEINAVTTSGDYLNTEATVLGGADYFDGTGGTNASFLTELYLAVLHRDEDPSGGAYYLGQLNSGAKTRKQVATALIHSTEASTRRVAGPAGATACDLTTLDGYTAPESGSYCIVLDRLADPSGQSYWVGQLSGSAQLPSLWASLAASTEYYNLAQT